MSDDQVRLWSLLAIAVTLVACQHDHSPREFVADPPKACSFCAAWNAPQAPFRIYGNSYFVGPRALSSVLIDTGDGLILIDGGLPQSAAVIRDNIEHLGYRLIDVRYILVSHVHYDHAGGVAALQRASGAQVLTSETGRSALLSGLPNADDPQFGFGPSETGFPAVKNVRAVADETVIKLGTVEITAHASPGHTPGGMSWTWRSCEETDCRSMVYLESLTAVSAPGYRFRAPASMAGQLRSTIDRVARFPCDVVIPTHPRLGTEGDVPPRAENQVAAPFSTPDQCRGLAERARQGLERRLAREADEG